MYRFPLLRCVATLLAALLGATAQAQDYPNRPIRIVVPFSPGGAVDGPTRAVAQEHLLDDEPGLDGLAETDVVGNQEVGTRHVNRAHERVELVVLDARAAAEGRLEVAAICVGRRAPPDRVEEGLKPRRVVERREPGHELALDEHQTGKCGEGARRQLEDGERERNAVRR